MIVIVSATPTFEATVKKLHDRDRKTVNAAIREIMAEPKIGKGKKRDLAGVFVHKFRINRAFCKKTVESFPRQSSGIQSLNNQRVLDSRFRGNDDKLASGSFCKRLIF